MCVLVLVPGQVYKEMKVSVRDAVLDLVRMGRRAASRAHTMVLNCGSKLCERALGENKLGDTLVLSAESCCQVSSVPVVVTSVAAVAVGPAASHGGRSFYGTLNPYA